jgi:hypothetical protein
MEAIIGHDISYTATTGMLVAAAVLIKQWVQPAPLDAQASSRR